MSTSLPYNEKELLLKIADGDEAAFTELFKRYSFSLGQIAQKILQDEAARQDMLQEVFIKLWLNRDQLPEVQYLAAWLKKIMLNECLMYLRKNAAHDKRLSKLEMSSTVDNAAPEQLDYKELQHRVQHFIESMPEQHRTIYQLNRAEGYSAAETAEKMGLSYGHVRNTISTILRSIRNHLDASFLLFIYFF